MRAWICLLLLITGCSDRLVIYHQFVKADDVASVRVNTPDPNPAEPGERLVMMWGLPPEYVDIEPKQLILWIRYHNGCEEELCFDLCGLSGRCIWEVRGDLHKETRGIASYRAVLMAGCELIEEWRHQVWVERIQILDSPQAP